MKEHYEYILTLKQKQWLHNQLRILENEWQYLVEEVILRGKYSDYEKGLLNKLGRLVKTKKKIRILNGIMYNNATFVDKEQLKNLKKMDNFVKDNMVRFTEEVGMQVREVITEIIKKGYYYEGQAEVLNMIANEYNNWKRENR